MHYPYSTRSSPRTACGFHYPLEFDTFRATVKRDTGGANNQVSENFSSFFRSRSRSFAIPPSSLQKSLSRVPDKSSSYGLSQSSILSRELLGFTQHPGRGDRYTSVVGTVRRSASTALPTRYCSHTSLISGPARRSIKSTSLPVRVELEVGDRRARGEHNLSISARHLSVMHSRLGRDVIATCPHPAPAAPAYMHAQQPCAQERSLHRTRLSGLTSLLGLLLGLGLLLLNGRELLLQLALLIHCLELLLTPRHAQQVPIFALLDVRLELL